MPSAQALERIAGGDVGSEELRDLPIVAGEELLVVTVISPSPAVLAFTTGSTERMGISC